MQPASPEVSQNATLQEQNLLHTTTSVQYGHSSTSPEPSGHLTDDGITRRSNSTVFDTDSASVSSAGTERGRTSDSRRLSSPHGSSQEGSPGSRINEYERAHGRAGKRSAGMLFEVIPSSKDKEDSISIVDLPSEVLIHVLSHLPADSLSAIGLVSKDFYKLVTSPLAWRVAFARYFSGPELETQKAAGERPSEELDTSGRQAFARVSALASWRSEYILRTRLLRSLTRGRPAVQPASRGNTGRQSGGSAAGAAVVTYGSGLLYPVSHIHATFGIGLNKKQPFFMHGAVEQGAVSSSDPIAAKISNWGLTDFEAFKHFADAFTGETEYGLGPGTMVGMPNVMDLSQPYGRIYGEALPGGRLFYTSVNEQRGRFLPIASVANHTKGVPQVSMLTSAVCSVWIAKSEPILKLSNGVIGSLAGFSNGVLEAFALGINPIHDRRYEKGEPTAKWVLCPGVPIIAISVDNKISPRRLDAGRIWAVVLNALGELFCLSDIPIRPEFKGKATPLDLESLAWQTGRSAEWKLIECTRRTAKPDPFNTAVVDGSYSPRLSSDAQGLSTEQIIAEIKEVEEFLVLKPKHFQNVCEGWDMRRRLLVDFGGDDGKGAGEAIFIIGCGLDESATASIRRICRQKVEDSGEDLHDSWPPISATPARQSIFGDSRSQTFAETTPSISPPPRSRTSSTDHVGGKQYSEAWYISNFVFGDFRSIQISAVATDDSEFAILSAQEDPLLGMTSGSQSSSPIGSPIGSNRTLRSPTEIPGQRARLFGVGTTNGVVLLWDMRAGVSTSVDVINTVQPSRYIMTKSPQISSLAMSALYVVHGGNDGLVQAWDPLASTYEPIRTLNSRFSDRARRRIAQAEASIHGVGDNYYAAGAIVLDPDPGVLRGLVSLGVRLRYWSYSSAGADAYRSRKRGQLRRRSERGSNSSPTEQKVTVTGRGMLRDYIANEKLELEREKVAKRKENEKLSGRFGIDLLGAGATDEELLAYATMLSEESFSTDEVKRSAVDVQAQQVMTKSGSSAAESKSSTHVGETIDPDLEEALRLSLLESEQVSHSPNTSDFDIPFRYAKSSRHGTPSKKGKAAIAGARSLVNTEDEDLEFALQLSLAEEQSKHVDDNEDFPRLDSMTTNEIAAGSRKGKGRSKRS